MRRTFPWQALCAAMIVVMVVGFLLPNVMVAPASASSPQAGAGQDVGTSQLGPGVYNTLRVYGRDNEGAGNALTLDPVTGRAPEDPPYTDVGSIFDPQGPQAPRKDFITWDPIWMHEEYTPDENQRLYQDIYISGINGSEKVYFRMWYEPRHLDKDLNADGSISETVDIVYPALMQEFTYQLTDIGYTPGASPSRLPLPAVGNAGSTSFVFPMAMRAGDLFDGSGNVDTTSGNARFGYGLTSLDANFDGAGDIVNIDSEATLATKLGLPAGTWLDFDGDEVLDNLSTDGAPLSGDELVVLSLNPVRLGIGESVQFLDYLVTLQAVGDSDAVVLVRYVGDRIPDNPAHAHTIPNGAVRFIDRHGSETPAPNGGDAVVAVPVSPFFVQLVAVDARDNAATVRIGRGLGAPYSAMESAPFSADLRPGDPWFLKRFYVDGHEYNVTAIGTIGTEGFRFITIRTPVPKVPVYIAQHSVELQDYGPQDWLSVMPPYNYEHFIFTDIQTISRFSDETVPPTTGTTPDMVEPYIDYVGRLVGPVPPILQHNGPFPYYGINPNVPYGDPREMFLFYVAEDVNRQYLGELKELYGEVPNPNTEDPVPFSEFWYDQQFWTQPWAYTELVLPDIQSTRMPAGVRDLYLLTSSFLADQTEMLQWIQNSPPPWAYNLVWDPVRETWVRDTTVNDFAGYWAPRDVPRVQFWFDPAEGGKKYKDEEGIRLYGRLNEGAGMGTVGDYIDPVNGAYPVEVMPYSDPWAPFNPDLPEAPRKDSLTFNPVYMSRDNSLTDPLRGLYGQISVEGQDAREKAFLRMWYEPQYYDKIRIANTSIYSFPAVMQEFTYMVLDTNDKPTHGRPGATNIAFPMATDADGLPRPDPSTRQLPPSRLPSFGYGINSFDANFDGTPDIVRVHSEFSLNQYLGTVTLDFNGNGSGTDYLDPDGVGGNPRMTGDEMVVFAVQNIHLRIGQSAQFLDYMVTLNNVASTPLGVAQAQFQLWYTGGGLFPQPGGGYSLQPLPVPSLGSTTDLQPGDAAVAGRNRGYVRRIANGTNNLGSVDGGWFIYVHSVNRTLEEATITIGRALGATYSAIDNGAGGHDLDAGDPWYLKRFFVDGHEYNVVAIRAEFQGDAGINEDPTEFKYITIRTPVPKVTFVNQQDSQVLQGYFQGLVWGVNTDLISVMPPFDRTHTISEDIVTLDPAKFAIPFWYDSDCAGIARPSRVVPALDICIISEDRDPQFFGELKQILDPAGENRWNTQQFNTLPDRFTELRLRAGELYLLTSNWRSSESIAHFYGCPLPPLNPATPDDPLITWNQQIELAAYRAGDSPISIPAPNMGPNYAVLYWPPVPQPPAPPTNQYLADYYDGLFDPNDIWTNSLRVKFWYDPQDVEDIYVNRYTMTPAVRTINLRQGWNLISFDVFPTDPAIASVLSGIAGRYTRVLSFDCNAGTPGLSYYPDLPALSSLQHMDPYHGYWIYMNSSATLTVQGFEIPDSTPIYLCAGWNLVSYLPESPLPVDVALQSINGLYSVVLGWDNGALSYYPDLPPGLNSLHQMEPGHGYWVKLTAPATLVYPEGFTMAASELEPNVLSTMVPPSNIWANFVALNSRFHGDPLPVGAVVRAFDPDGVLCGETVVAVEGGFVMAVYGDDPQTPEDEGAKVGDIIRFTVNDEPVITMPKDPVWPGNMERVDIVIGPLRSLLPIKVKQWAGQ